MNLLEPIQINFDSALPVWLQLRNRMAHLIALGAYRKGDRLPTVRALAAELDISYDTVNRAYMELEREEYVKARRGRGTVVIRANVAKEQEGFHVVEAMVADMITLARSAGMDDGNILSLVQEKLA